MTIDDDRPDLPSCRHEPADPNCYRCRLWQVILEEQESYPEEEPPPALLEKVLELGRRFLERERSKSQS